MPQVSIITPFYNAADQIARCIASVQEQSLEDIEHLVIDNMSTDAGADIARQASQGDARIKVLENNASQGAGATRNVGIAAATGRYIAFLDADDSWHPEKLSRQIAFIEETGSAFSWTAYDIRGRDGVLIRSQSARSEVSYADLLAKRAVIGCLTAVYDTHQLGKVYMSDLPMRQDFCLWLDILRTCDREGLTCRGLNEPLADYSVGGMTANKKKAAIAQWRALRDHVDLPLIPAAMAFSSYIYNALKDRA